MNRKLLIVLIISTLSNVTFAEGNVGSRIYQNSDNSTIKVIQRHSDINQVTGDSSVDIEQIGGANNQVDILQNNSNTVHAQVMQQGNNQSLTVRQLASTDSMATVSQLGEANRTNVHQSGLESSNSTVTQNGSNNNALMRQTGADNSNISITQEGTDNYDDDYQLNNYAQANQQNGVINSHISITQEGSNIAQVGQGATTNSNISVTQKGSDHFWSNHTHAIQGLTVNSDIFVTQEGTNANDIYQQYTQNTSTTVQQVGQSNNNLSIQYKVEEGQIDSRTIGDGNLIVTEQSYSSNDKTNINVIGNNNDIGTEQGSYGLGNLSRNNSLDYNVEGNNNIGRVSQSNSEHSVTINQNGTASNMDICQGDTDVCR